MPDFCSILSAAQELSEQDRVRLIDALWDTMPQAQSGLSDEWVREIERRVAALDAGKAHTIPWSLIRDEAIARIGNAQAS